MAALRRHLAPGRTLRDDHAAPRGDSRACRSRARFIEAAAGLEAAGQRRAARRRPTTRRSRAGLTSRSPGSAAATSRYAEGDRAAAADAYLRAIMLAPGRCGGAQQPRRAPARRRLPRGIAAADRARVGARGRHGARIRGRGQPREDRGDRAAAVDAASSRTGPGRTERAAQTFGGTFALSRNRFIGSYFALSATSRSRFGPKFSR